MFWEIVATILVVILLALTVIALGVGALFGYELIADIIRMRKR